VHKPPSFPPTKTKNGNNTFMFVGQFGVSQAGPDNGMSSTLVEFFHQIIVRQPIERKVLYKPSAEYEEIRDGFLYEAAKNFNLFSKCKFPGPIQW
jgi:hypothetical protein